ncbi:MAG: pimelyl-ACP methyl ester esterase BioV [Campylobacterota bacterium]|nr:pimelyl-ACP methyl ester esterase BioV [Campylobacterota bacterium]
MRYYNGFSLKNEEYLFGDYLSDSDYSICGFSYGAIKAFQELKRELELGNRVDKLILISPAFFQTKPIKFKKLQLMAYRKNKERYLKQFIDSCFSPYQKKIVEYKETTIEELDELLNYEWIVDEFKILEQKGIKVEVYLGGEDKIIDVAGARELFLKVSTVTYIKSVNHFLQIN